MLRLCLANNRRSRASDDVIPQNRKCNATRRGPSHCYQQHRFGEVWSCVSEICWGRERHIHVDAAWSQYVAPLPRGKTIQPTRASAIAEGPRDDTSLFQLTFCQILTTAREIALWMPEIEEWTLSDTRSSDIALLVVYVVTMKSLCVAMRGKAWYVGRSA